MFRELVRKKQQLPAEECIKILKETKRGVLAVLGDEEYPYTVPMNHWYCEEDGKLYFHSGKTGHKIDAFTKHPKASFCVMDDGYHDDGDWVMHFRSVIVFGKIETVEDRDWAMEATRRLSFKFTPDAEHIEKEVREHGARTLCFALVPEHISGKRVNEE